MEGKKKKKMRRRVFILKVIWKDPEENNEIAEFPYDPEEHVLYFRASVCSARTFLPPPPIKHPSNACRSLNFIFYQTKYKTRAQNISNKLSKRFSLRANEHPADFFFFFFSSIKADFVLKLKVYTYHSTLTVGNIGFEI